MKLLHLAIAAIIISCAPQAHAALTLTITGTFTQGEARYDPLGPGPYTVTTTFTLDRGAKRQNRSSYFFKGVVQDFVVNGQSVVNAQSFSTFLIAPYVQFPGSKSNTGFLDIYIGGYPGQLDLLFPLNRGSSPDLASQTFFDSIGPVIGASFDLPGAHDEVNGLAISVSGTTPYITILSPVVPEPGTWAMMFVGFGALGHTMRRKRRSPASVRLA